MNPQVLEPQSASSTSAEGAMRAASAPPIVLCFDPSSPSTATRDPRHEDWLLVSSNPLLSGTSATLPTAPTAGPADARTALAEFRRLSGLTWDQLAQVFGVSRRILHLWASGKPLGAPNEEHLRRLLAVLRRADRGAAGANRALLLTEHEGTIPIDLLVEHRYEEFLQLVGEGPGRRTVARRPLSRQAWEARKPSPPDELVDATQDRVHKDVGRGR
ncbi:MAG: XRE family transcriptional regulator, partial [Deltaproteobacteria bacterium]